MTFASLFALPMLASFGQSLVQSSGRMFRDPHKHRKSLCGQTIQFVNDERGGT